ncbi:MULTISPECIES: nucleotidyltransferase family protein [unclassified Streptomyces]|uniref:nucleotidyltransferase family protein n=1 Tax=unclassified Streptomyces TaxID=2593676 RepID=UPI0009A0C044|nr:sugar phosphate nucleotidyltransferase [Streptomyces sp. CB02058]
MRAVVLAGGEGRRLRPATFDVPKPLMELDGEPMLHIILSQLRDAGFTRVTLSLGYRAQMIQDSIEAAGWRGGLDIDFCHESEPLGTAGPLGLVPPIEDSTLVMNADLLTDLDFAALWTGHRKAGSDATVVLAPQHIDIAHGVVRIDEDHRVVGYEEKPRLNFLISCGIYVLEPSVLDHLPAGSRYDMPALLESLRTAGGRVGGHVFDGDWCDIGTPEQLRRAAATFGSDRARFVRDGVVRDRRRSEAVGR